MKVAMIQEYIFKGIARNPQCKIITNIFIIMIFGRILEYDVFERVAGSLFCQYKLFERHFIPSLRLSSTNP